MVRRAIIISIKWFLQEMSEALGVLIELPEKVMPVSGPSGLITTLPAMARYIYQKLKKITCLYSTFLMRPVDFRRMPAFVID